MNYTNFKMASTVKKLTILSKSFSKNAFVCSRHLHYRCEKNLSWQRHFLHKARPQHTIFLLSARLASTNMGIPSGYIPDVPTPPKLDIIEHLPQLNSLGEPYLSSLGLGSWFPPGRMQAILEFFHVSVDIPWWASITAVAITVRCLLFPLLVKQRRVLTNMVNHKPTVERLQKRVEIAKVKGNNVEVAKYAQQLREFMVQNEINPLKSLYAPLVQFPLMLSMFLGLRSMAALPVESFKSGGALWFTDLTVPDPYFVLPVVTFASLLLIVEVGSESTKASHMAHHMKWFMRAMPVVAMVITASQPAALAFYWTVNNIMSLIVAMLFKTDVVKRVFKIPQIYNEKVKPESKGFVQGFKDSSNGGFKT
ncbi:mitochondrial inner membrane protein OXA1L-like isoform X3 [Dreissena polymorpha]|uniref:mitochondrial inner membrane protein OXA1L-like isoform X3 n=1 Tax=Dreissena polymorpha TaxID=45954 RepID=UPI002264F4DD|nr:mitochondrial inner membrane protein OXA1L-like isoform X3 [Dreissena polymorpha]